MTDTNSMMPELTLNAEAAQAEVPQLVLGNEAPAAPAVPVGTGDRGELVAAISAALAEELGTDISGIRILSLKKLQDKEETT